MIRLTDGFRQKSRKPRAHDVDLFHALQFVRIHQTLKVTQVMAELWEMADAVKVLEDWETLPRSFEGLRSGHRFINCKCLSGPHPSRKYPIALEISMKSKDYMLHIPLPTCVRSATCLLPH